MILRITDGSGALVQTLEEPGAPGLHRIVWRFAQRGREPVAPGEYTATLEAAGTTQARTVVVKPPVILPRG